MTDMSEEKKINGELLERNATLYQKKTAAELSVSSRVNLQRSTLIWLAEMRLKKRQSVQ